MVERLYAERLPEPPSRAWQWPGEAVNDLGAWYVAQAYEAAVGGFPAPPPASRLS